MRHFLPPNSVVKLKLCTFRFLFNFWKNTYLKESIEASFNIPLHDLRNMLGVAVINSLPGASGRKPF
jgi:hypothetical protein